MNYDQLMYFHLATIVPAFVIGTLMMIVMKGTALHRLLGKGYMSLMMITGIITLFMPARLGPTFLGHFGYIHLLSFLTLYSVPSALIAIRRGDVKKHKSKMIQLYIGGILIAGGFTFFPGRFLYQLFFG